MNMGRCCSVDIIILTYKRPHLLLELLAALQKLSFERINQPDIRLIVVDNDPEASAKSILNFDLPYDICYYVEERPGISYARNAGLEHVRPDVDFIAFIDDDEVPAPHWLEELLVVQAATKADIVTGPVITLPQAPLPSWIARGGFLSRKRHIDRSFVTYARTGNVLLSKRVIDTIGCFDESLALRGGEDTEFFKRALQSGYLIAWADHAEVYEKVYTDRMTVTWILSRAYRTAQTDTYVVLRQNNFVVKIRKAIGAFVRIVVGSGMTLLTMPAALLGRYEVPVRWLRVACRGTGILMAMLGLWYEEYGRRKSSDHAD